MADAPEGGEAVAAATGRALADAGRPLVPTGAARRLSGGASRQTWVVEVADDRGSPCGRVVVQVVRPGAIGTGGGLDAEVALLEVAAGAGVPVPEVLAHRPDGAGLGRPFAVVSHVAGETIARRILRDDRWAAARASLVADCGAALAATHRIDPAAVPSLPHPDPVAQLRAVLDGYGTSRPTFEVALRWLEQQRPAPGPTVVLHGDFRLGNLIVGPDGLAAVIDWELAHVGDPLEDLAWLCTRAWRFGAAPPVAGIGGYDELLDAYAAAGGPDLDVGALRWWLVHGTLRWGVICVIQSMAHLQGHSRSVELASIGRRVAEQEWDLLELLG